MIMFGNKFDMYHILGIDYNKLSRFDMLKNLYYDIKFILCMILFRYENKIYNETHVVYISNLETYVGVNGKTMTMIFYNSWVSYEVMKYKFKYCAVYRSKNIDSNIRYSDWKKNNECYI